MANEDIDEMADELYEAISLSMARSIDKLREHVDQGDVDTKSSAHAHARQLIDATAARLDLRVSSSADHLARLEARVQALEQQKRGE